MSLHRSRDWRENLPVLISWPNDDAGGGGGGGNGGCDGGVSQLCYINTLKDVHLHPGNLVRAITFAPGPPA